jgi:septal ring factor EnvC (AmiA/AmiB activator)
MRKLALAAVLAALTIGMAGCADPNTPLVPAAAVVRAQEMNAAQVEDAQLTAKTARVASEWQTQQEAAAELAAQQAAEAAAAAAAQAAAEEAARQAAAEAAEEQAAADNESTSDDSGTPAGGGSSSGLPSGSVVPSIPGTTAPDTTQCASGSASTINGVPTCD